MHNLSKKTRRETKHTFHVQQICVSIKSYRRRDVQTDYLCPRIVRLLTHSTINIGLPIIGDD
jgi:hypothetical protein